MTQAEEVGGRPTVAVVIANIGPATEFHICLDALARQKHGPTETIVVTPTDVTAPTDNVVIVKAAANTLVPAMWATGIRASGCDVVAITTSHFMPSPDWVERIQEAHLNCLEPAIGGSIRPPSSGNPKAWATYLLRYSAYSALRKKQAITDFAGDNGSYKSWVFDRYPECLDGGFWEQQLHQMLCKENQELVFDPSISVEQTSTFGFWEFVRQRFQHGFQFGRSRVLQRGRLFRIAGILAAPLIPCVLMTKVIRTTLAGGHGRQLLFSSPILSCFILAWSIGEVCGYVCSSGQSASTNDVRQSLRGSTS